jgi:hypothetical protein
VNYSEFNGECIEEVTSHTVLKAFRCQILFDVIEHISQREVRAIGLVADLVNETCSSAGQGEGNLER